MVANNQILKLIETCLLSICLLKMLELSFSVFYGSKLGSRTWRDKTWKGMDWFLVFIKSNAQVTRVSLGLYRTDTSQVGSLLGTWPISDTAGQLWINIYLYPCWWPTIFSITSQCWLGLRLHYPAAPIASTPYDMSGRCYHRMVVARAEYLFSAKDWRQLNLLTMYLRVLHKQRKISILPLEPINANLK